LVDAGGFRSLDGGTDYAEVRGVCRNQTAAGIWVKLRLRMSPLILKAALSDAVFGDEALTTALAQLRCLVAVQTS
jgi:hypothetical protein